MPWVLPGPNRNCAFLDGHLEKRVGGLEGGCDEKEDPENESRHAEIILLLNHTEATAQAR